MDKKGCVQKPKSQMFWVSNMVAELNQKNIRYFHLILSLPSDQRGIELSAEAMDKLGGCPRVGARLRGIHFSADFPIV